MSGEEEREFREGVESDYRKSVLEMMESQNTVYSYGSRKAISLLAEIQKIFYSYQGNLTESNNNDIFVAYFILLATQIRYDVTGEVISPVYWYEINISDFSKHKEKYIRYNNQIVKELALNKELEICREKVKLSLS